MARWEPHARERLERAALALLAEQGYDATTVAQIADRAGLTKSTFFRHYADKREVLFGGQDLLSEVFSEAIRTAPPSATTADCLTAALAAAAAAFTPERHDLAPQRRTIIAAHSELQERELLKRARLASVMADALRARGADEVTARLAAEVGVLAFSTAYARWAAPDNRLPFTEIARAALHELQASATTLGVPELRDDRRAVRRDAHHSLTEARRADPERGVEAVEVHQRQQGGDLHQLAIVEVRPHAREQLVRDLDRRAHHRDRVVERRLLALGEQVAGLVARQGKQFFVGEAGVAADLRAEVDAVLTPDHLSALQLDQVLDPLVDGLALADRLVEPAHAHHHLRLVRPDLDRLDTGAGLRIAAGHLRHHPGAEPVNELDDRAGLGL